MGNYYAPDGYRYGVMFNDGSVGEWFNGRTQRQRAEEYVVAILERHRQWKIEHGWPLDRADHITVARHLPGQPWERVEDQNP